MGGFKDWMAKLIMLVMLLLGSGGFSKMARKAFRDRIERGMEKLWRHGP